jgi:hypothetical protein
MQSPFRTLTPSHLRLKVLGTQSNLAVDEIAHFDCRPVPLCRTLE